MKHRRWLGSMAGAALAIAIAVLLGGPPYAWAAGPQPPAARIQSMRDGAAAMRKSGELPLAGCTWTGATDSDWATATNWTGCVGATPAGSDAVTIDSGANQPIMSNGTNVTILSLAINSGASVQVSGMLSITNGSGSGRLDLQGGGTLNVQPGGVVSIGSGTTISGTLAVKSGALARFDLGYSNATITSTGVLTGGGDVLVTNIIPASGGLAVYAGYHLGGQLTLDATGRASFYTPSSVPRLSIIDAFSALDGNSTVTVTQAMTWTGGNLNGTLTLVIGPGATLNVDSASTIQLGGSGKLYNSGTANWLRGTFYANSLAFVNQPGGVFNALGNITFDANFNNYGALNILSGTLLTNGFAVIQNGGSTALNGGALASTSSGTYLMILNSGTLTGSGVITGQIHNVGANVMPGSPLGTLSMVGNYFQETGGRLSIELGGTSAGSSYDAFNITGTAYIYGGGLVISQTNGFQANAGDSFRIINYNQRYEYTTFTSITNALATTHFVQLNPDHMLLTEPAAYARLSKRPYQTVSEIGTPNGYTLEMFNPAALSVTLSIISDTLPTGFAYLPGSTTGATSADPSIDSSGGHQTLSWNGSFGVPPNGNIVLNFGVLVAPATTGTYSNSAAMRVSSSVSDTRVISINNVAPVIVPLSVTHNLSIAAPGASVQNTNPPQILISRAKAGTVPVSIIALISCPFDACGTLQNVFLVHGPISYTMQLISGTVQALQSRKPGNIYGYWQGTIPGTGIIPGVPIQIFPDWDDHHPCIGPGNTGCVPGDPSPGTPHLYDPSGHVTDAQTSLPIANATVTLYRAPALLPDTRSETRGCRTVNTRPGGVGGNWDSVPSASLGLGTLEDALLAPASIDPPVNPQRADADGHYGWNVVTGCWFVVANAPGYVPKISAPVGVPPEVTDLNIALQPLPNRVYLPVMVR